MRDTNMTDNIITYITTLTNEQLVNAINKTAYKDIANDLTGLNITGSDLLDLNDFQIVYKYRNALSKDKIKRLQTLVNNLKEAPFEIFNRLQRTPSIKKAPTTKTTIKPTLPTKPHLVNIAEQKINFIRGTLGKQSTNTANIQNILQGINNLTSDRNIVERKGNVQNQVQSQKSKPMPENNQQLHKKLDNELAQKVSSIRRRSLLEKEQTQKILNTDFDNKTGIESKAESVTDKVLNVNSIQKTPKSNEQLGEYINVPPNQERPPNSSATQAEYVNEEFHTTVNSADDQVHQKLDDNLLQQISSLCRTGPPEDEQQKQEAVNIDFDNKTDIASNIAFLKEESININSTQKDEKLNEELPQYINILTNQETPLNSSQEQVEYVNEEFNKEVDSTDQAHFLEDSENVIALKGDTNNEISPTDYINLSNADQPVEYWEVADDSEPIYENEDCETNSNHSAKAGKTPTSSNEILKSDDTPPALPNRPKLVPLRNNVKVFKPSNKSRNSDSVNSEKKLDIEQLDQTSNRVHRNSGNYDPLPKLQQTEAIPEQDYEVPIVELSPMHLLTMNKFFKSVSRSEGDSLLKNTKQGSYLLRHSTVSENFAVLMIKGATKIQNVPILYERNTYALKANRNTKPEIFNSLVELLDNYTKHPINGETLIASSDNWLPELW